MTFSSTVASIGNATIAPQVIEKCNPNMDR